VEGYQTFQASNGKLALEIVRKEAPDLVHQGDYDDGLWRARHDQGSHGFGSVDSFHQTL
jgi:hypothetical protein